jgi:hypothetical protein
MCEGKVAWVVLASNLYGLDMVNVEGVGVEHHINRLLTNETLSLL